MDWNKQSNIYSFFCIANRGILFSNVKYVENLFLVADDINSLLEDILGFTEINDMITEILIYSNF